MKHHRIGERELPEIVMIERAVVHEFIGFFKIPVHPRNIPVAYFRTKEVLAKFDTTERKQSDLHAEFEAMTNERRRLALRLNELEGTTAALRRTASTAAGELGRTQSMAAELNTRYEKLLTEKATLNHLNEAQLTEIERIRVALEDAQRDVARLTNAHGIYTIKEGDSLSTVAAVFYANGNYWPRIAEANRFLIGDNPDLIFAGMVLIIP